MYTDSRDMMFVDEDHSEKDSIVCSGATASRKKENGIWRL